MQNNDNDSAIEVIPPMSRAVWMFMMVRRSPFGLRTIHLSTSSAKPRPQGKVPTMQNAH